MLLDFLPLYISLGIALNSCVLAHIRTTQHIRDFSLFSYPKYFHFIASGEERWRTQNRSKQWIFVLIYQHICYGRGGGGEGRECQISERESNVTGTEVETGVYWTVDSEKVSVHHKVWKNIIIIIGVRLNSHFIRFFLNTLPWKEGTIEAHVTVHIGEHTLFQWINAHYFGCYLINWKWA